MKAANIFSVGDRIVISGSETALDGKTGVLKSKKWLAGRVMYEVTTDDGHTAHLFRASIMHKEKPEE